MIKGVVLNHNCKYDKMCDIPPSAKCGDCIG